MQWVLEERGGGGGRENVAKVVEGADGGVVELWPSCRRGTLKRDTRTISTEAVHSKELESPQEHQAPGR